MAMDIGKFDIKTRAIYTFFYSKRHAQCTYAPSFISIQLKKAHFLFAPNMLRMFETRIVCCAGCGVFICMHVIKRLFVVTFL